MDAMHNFITNIRSPEQGPNDADVDEDDDDDFEDDESSHDEVNEYMM